MRYQNKETYKIAVLILATLLAGTGIVTAYNINGTQPNLVYLRVIDMGNIVDVNLSQQDKLISANSTIAITGCLSTGLSKNQHLWIAVKPDKSITNWWPQSNGEIIPNKQGEFEGNAFLGGDRGEVFTIGILVLDDKLNDTFSEWVAHSNIKKIWPPITEGDPITGTKVSKNTVDDTILAHIRLRLIEERVMPVESGIIDRGVLA